MEKDRKAQVKKGPLRSALRTLGPIPDLERHLPSDWWRTLFNSLYIKTDGDVVENENTTRHEVDLIVRYAALEPNDRILDLCCGQGRHSMELARRGFRNVVGIDRSRYLIRLAKKRARELGIPVSFHEGDARKFRFGENTFHCVLLLGNSFGYFESEDDDRAVLTAVRRALISHGTLYLDLVDGEWMRDHYQPRSWEWIDQNYFVNRERSLGSDGRRLISREIIAHAEKGVVADQFYAERLYTRAQIAELLESTGFTDLRFHAGLATPSDRGQDLGMMEHRMLLTAVGPTKHVRSAVKRGPLYPDMTVLLGDPRLPDTVKRDGQFNDEDIDTVNRLKSALTELPGYGFRFVDDHAALASALRADPPKFVVNLADEGYNNDAFKELHIPALLETLNIPYTGAGPACLGLCYNKSHVRAIAAGMDIPVPSETYFNTDDQAATLPSVFPALVKPNFGDSSIGITVDAVVHDTEHFIAHLESLRQTFAGRPLLIQEFLTGAEYSVGIIGNPGLTYTVLPILEVDYSKLDPGLPPILGYESKWLPDSPYWTQIQYRPATLDEEIQRKLLDFSNLLFERLGCRDYARIDFRADADGVIKLLEVNPNPGWCWDGKMNIMAGFGGLRYADFLRLILEAAQERVAYDSKRR